MWNEKCEATFSQLKQLLTTAPILIIDDQYGEFVVCIDAWKEGLGGVLMKNGYVISYESRKLKDHERNYLNHNFELDPLIHALKMWRHYFMGKTFILKTDNL